MSGLVIRRGALAAVVGCVACVTAEVPIDGGADAAMRDATLVDAPLGDRADAAVDAGDAHEDADVVVGACLATACDLRDAGSCSDGGSCLLVATGAACVAAGVIPAHGACAASTDCLFGYACFRKSGSAGRCERVCCPGDPNACVADERCEGLGVLVDGNSTSWAHCVSARSCDVLVSEQICDPGEGCYIVSADAGTDCRVAGVAGAEEACVGSAGCEPGFACVGFGETHCARLCSTAPDGGAPCPVGEGDCVSYSHTPDGVGLCT